MSICVIWNRKTDGNEVHGWLDGTDCIGTTDSPEMKRSGIEGVAGGRCGVEDN